MRRFSTWRFIVADGKKSHEIQYYVLHHSLNIMKRFTFLMVAAVVSMFSFVSAQDSTANASQKEEETGGTAILKIGRSWSDIMNLDDNWNSQDGNWISERKTGWTGGLALEFPVASWFAIQPEVIYTMKGAQGTDKDESNTEITTQGIADLHYVEIPILFKFTAKVRRFVGVGGFIYFGPYGAVNVYSSVKKDVISNATGAVISSKNESMEDFIPAEAGGIFGAGVEFGIFGVRAIIDGRLTMGLTPMTDDREHYVNRVASVTLGIGF